MHIFIRRARCRFVPPDSPSFETLCRTADEELFNNITVIIASTLILAVTVARVAKLQSRSAHAGTTLKLPDRVSHLTD